MLILRPLIKILVCICFLPLVIANCDSYSPAFPVPSWSGNDARALSSVFESIGKGLQHLVATERYNKSSISITVTSSSESLWSFHHTAVVRNESRLGTKQVDEDSQYRIASISKVFTVLGILKQHAAGNLSLDDPVSKYITQLPEKGKGGLPWKDITIRALASQLSGIPRDFGQSDLINAFPDPTVVGLPPASRDNLPDCFEYGNFKDSCTSEDFLKALDREHPLFAPNQESTYSNQNYDLLGLVLERVTSLDYGKYIRQSIFEELNMTLTSTRQPSDEHAVLPYGQTFWDIDLGVDIPTGGIYSSAKDMSKMVRYIMTHYNALVTGVNWLMPVSYAMTLNSFYGMPFEVFRTDKILKTTRRPVTFVTKSGGLPNYFSRIYVLPEFGLGLTILVGGEATLLGEAQEIVTVELVRAAERIIWENMKEEYADHYEALDHSLNSTITLESSPEKGLHLTSFISNGTDVFDKLLSRFKTPAGPFRAQLVPTLLYKDEKKQQGEIYRIILVSLGDSLIWDDDCITDVDIASYAGLPLNEVVFWHEDGVVELPAWRLKLSTSTSRRTNRLEQPLKS